MNNYKFKIKNEGVCAPALTVFLLSFCIFNFSFGQTVLTADGLAAFGTNATAGGGGGGGGSFALLRHATGSAAGNSQASVTIDVSGGALLIVSVSNYQPANGGLDANPAGGGNTYTGLNAVGAVSSHITTNQIFYVINPTGGSITITCTHSYTILNAAVFSDSGGTPSLVTQAAGGHSDSTTTIQPGSLTPSATHLFVTGVASSKSFAGTPINSSFNVTDAVQQGGNGLWGGLAYKISGSAENPTWSFSASGTVCGTTMAEFAP